MRKNKKVHAFYGPHCMTLPTVEEINKANVPVGIVDTNEVSRTLLYSRIKCLDIQFRSINFISVTRAGGLICKSLSDEV